MMLKSIPISPKRNLIDNSDVEFFLNNGYLLVENAFSDDAIDEVRAHILKLFNKYDQVSPALKKDLDETSSILKSPEVERCLWYIKDLNKSVVYKTLEKLAHQILGKGCFMSYDHSILKMPYSNSPTLWHQDEAYDLNSGHATNPPPRITFWIPLQDVDKNNGTMSFIPTHLHNQVLLPHVNVIPGGKVLKVELPDYLEPYAVRLNMKKGSFSIHNGKCLHSAEGNVSGDSRYTWIVSFEVGSKSYYTWRHFIKDRFSIRRLRA